MLFEIEIPAELLPELDAYVSSQGGGMTREEAIAHLVALAIRPLSVSIGTDQSELVHRWRVGRATLRGQELVALQLHGSSGETRSLLLKVEDAVRLARDIAQEAVQSRLDNLSPPKPN